MDPYLWELFEYGEADDEVAAIIRLGHYAALPKAVRVVTQFEEIVTVRLARKDIPMVSGAPEVASITAGDTYLGPDLELDASESISGRDLSLHDTDLRRPESLSMTGRGIVIGVVDWGFDFAHPDFRKPDGTTRILALWDQRGGKRANSPQPFGYGVLHDRDAINQALKTKDPYAALGYHPADADTGIGSHGTHVASIAAGTGGDGRPVGIAPEADLVLVHNAPWDGLESGKLGDSVTLLEGIDFISRTAAGRPWVINLSMGRHGEQHDGSTLIEQGLDAAVRSAPGRAVCLSTGNYFNKQIHASGQLRPTEERTFAWVINQVSPTDYNQLEIWYSSQDKMEVRVRSPDGSIAALVRLGEKVKLLAGGKEVGNVYHRAQEPNTLDHHITIFLYKNAPAGEWDVTLTGTDVIHGDYHAWIEREVSCPRCQSHFRPKDADPRSTTGTICNGKRTLAVGAYDAHDPDHLIAPFSSVGPTRDGRLKPDLCAPGMAVLAARSASRSEGRETPLLTRMSGTSMAAPHVTGTVALMFQAAVRPLRIEDTHNLLLGSARRVNVKDEIPDRIGIGFLDVERAVDAGAKATGAPPTFKVIKEQPAPPKRDESERFGVIQSDRGPTIAAAIDAAESEGVSVGRIRHPAQLSAEPMPVDAESELADLLDQSTSDSVFEGAGARPQLATGSQGAAVRDAQDSLNRYHLLETANGRSGLPEGVLAVDGQFGTRTYRNVLAFQRQVFANDTREVDGVIGPKTWAMLDRVPALPDRPDPKPMAITRTDPNYWFLDAAEIAAACGGAESRRRLNVSTSNNLVQVLVDGADYMKSLHDDLVATGAGDFFHLTAWRLNITQDLVPTLGAPLSSPSRFGNVLATVTRRGVRARALIFKAVASGYSTASVTTQIRENTQARDWYNLVGGKGVIDGRYPIYGSHHQKSAIIQRNGEAVAYCGGIDICPDRWDTALHDSDPRRTREAYAGWHDVHLRLRGPAVLDIEANFRDRWNSRSEQPCDIPPEPYPPPILDPVPPVARSPGTHHVQVVRTFGCLKSHFKDFLPGGEFTCRAGYRKAIGRAAKYIYIEDQYLTSEELALALESALDTIEQLIIVVSANADTPPIEAANYHQAKFIAILSRRHAAKVHVFHLTQPSSGSDIYVHAKVMIVDDIFAVAGSPNVNRRSMTHDTEIAAAVVDADVVDGVCRYARDIRLKLWSEHLNLSPSDPLIADPVVGVAEWERQAALGTMRVRRHVAPSPQREWGVIWDHIVDPDGRCGTHGFLNPILESEAAGGESAAVPALPSPESVAEMADAIVSNSTARVGNSPLLQEVMARHGLGEALALPGRSGTAGAAEIFSAVAYAPHHPLGQRLQQHFEVLARPGESLNAELQAGDVLVRRGDVGHGHVAIVASPDLRSSGALLASGGRPESWSPGHFAEVVEGGVRPRARQERFGRRVVDAAGRMPSDQLLLRPRWVGESSERIDPLSLVLGLGVAGAFNRPVATAPAAAPASTPPTRDPDTGSKGDDDAADGDLDIEAPIDAEAVETDRLRLAALAERDPTLPSPWPPRLDAQLAPVDRKDPLQRAVTLVGGAKRFKGMAFAIADLSHGAPRKYIGSRDGEQRFVASTGKLAILLAAFQLRKAVREAALLVTDPSVKTDSQLFAAILRQWRGTIGRYFHGTKDSRDKLPSLERIFKGTSRADAGWDVEFSDKVPAGAQSTFVDNLKSAVLWSVDDNAARCVRDLGFPYIHGCAAEAGLWKDGRGLWLALDYGGQFWWPETFKDVGTPQAASARSLVQFMTLLETDELVPGSRAEMCDMLSGARSGSAQGALSHITDGLLRLPAAESKTLETRAKVGYTGENTHTDVAIVRRQSSSGELHYVVAVIGALDGTTAEDAAFVLDNVISGAGSGSSESIGSEHSRAKGAVSAFFVEQAHSGSGHAMTVPAWAAGVGPFPDKPGYDFDASPTTSLATAFHSVTANNPTKLCVGLVDLTDPWNIRYAGDNDREMVYAGSMMKIVALYAAFALRNRVQVFVEQAIAKGASTDSKDIWPLIDAAWRPQLKALFPDRPEKPFGLAQDIVVPQLGKMFSIVAGKVDFATDTTVTEQQLEFIGVPDDKDGDAAEFGVVGSFKEWMRGMIRWSSNIAASKVIDALGSFYINGLLQSTGFYVPDVADPHTGVGLWLSGDYQGHDWVGTATDKRRNAAGPKLTKRWADNQPDEGLPRVRANMAATACQTARLMKMLAADQLVKSDSVHGSPCKEMRELLAMSIATIQGKHGIGSYIKSALTPVPPDPARPVKAFIALYPKKGYGNDSSTHECGIVERTVSGKHLKYVAVVLGSLRAQGRADFEDMVRRMDDAIVASNP